MFVSVIHQIEEYCVHLKKYLLSIYGLRALVVISLINEMCLFNLYQIDLRQPSQNVVYGTLIVSITIQNHTPPLTGFVRNLSHGRVDYNWKTPLCL